MTIAPLIGRAWNVEGHDGPSRIFPTAQANRPNSYCTALAHKGQGCGEDPRWTVCTLVDYRPLNWYVMADALGY